MWSDGLASVGNGIVGANVGVAGGWGLWGDGPADVGVGAVGANVGVELVNGGGVWVARSLRV